MNISVCFCKTIQFLLSSKLEAYFIRKSNPLLHHYQLGRYVVQLTHINFVVVVVVSFLFYLAFLYVLYVSHKLNFIMPSSRLS